MGALDIQKRKFHVSRYSLNINKKSRLYRQKELQVGFVVFQLPLCLVSFASHLPGHEFFLQLLNIRRVGFSISFQLNEEMIYTGTTKKSGEQFSRLSLPYCWCYFMEGSLQEVAVWSLLVMVVLD